MLKIDVGGWEADVAVSLVLARNLGRRAIRLFGIAVLLGGSVQFGLRRRTVRGDLDVEILHGQILEQLEKIIGVVEVVVDCNRLSACYVIPLVGGTYQC